MVRFSRLLAAAAVSTICIGIGAAAAADLPRKAPPRVMAPVSDWTGFYAGVNLGYGTGQNSITDSTVSGAGIGILPVGTALYGGPRSFDSATRGINGGVQAGYNWQVSPVTVFGFETDIQGADMKRTASCVQACNQSTAIAPGFVPGLFPVTFSDNTLATKLDWFGTVRARAGYTTGPSLFYVTGGFAYGEVDRRGSVAGTTNFAGIIPVNTFAGAYSTKSTETGWTVGAGIEAKLWAGWTAKAEYLYVDLGHVSDTFNTVFITGAGTGTVAASRTITSEIRENIFRVGLNYKLGARPL